MTRVRVLAALTMILTAVQVGCSSTNPIGSGDGVSAENGGTGSVSGSITMAAETTVGSAPFDLSPPYDDLKLCDLFDSGALMTAVGGVQATSLPGADAERIAEIEAGPGGVYPALGQCNVMLNANQYFAVSVVDLGSVEEAADELSQRLDMNAEFGGAAFVALAITPGTYFDTGYGVLGHTGQYNVGCGLSSSDGSTEGREPFADGPAAACAAVVAELAALLGT